MHQSLLIIGGVVLMAALYLVSETGSWMLQLVGGLGIAGAFVCIYIAYLLMQRDKQRIRQ